MRSGSLWNSVGDHLLCPMNYSHCILDFEWEKVVISLTNYVLVFDNECARLFQRGVGEGLHEISRFSCVSSLTRR